MGGVQLRVGQEQSRGEGAAALGPPTPRQRGVSHQGPPRGGASGQVQSLSNSLASTLQVRLQPFIFLPIGAALPHHMGRPDAGPWGQGLEAPPRSPPPQDSLEGFPTGVCLLGVTIS